MALESGVQVQILDREFMIACADHEKSDVLASARYLNDRLGEIKNQSRILTTDRLVMLTALNMANEFLALRSKVAEYEQHLSKVSSLQAKLDMALSGT